MNVKLIDHIKGIKPNIQLSTQRVEANTWKDLGFAKHHYLTEDINKSCKCFVFYWGEEIVGFCGVLNTPRKGYPNGCAISRVVVKPDFQGLGIGSKICNFIGSIYTANGNELYIKTVNPALGIYFTNHPEIWGATSYNGKIRKVAEFEQGKYNNRVLRKSYCFKYVGEGNSNYSELLLPVAEMRKLKKELK